MTSQDRLALIIIAITCGLAFVAYSALIEHCHAIAGYGFSAYCYASGM
jgi:hypothetical protein